MSYIPGVGEEKEMFGLVAWFSRLWSEFCLDAQFQPVVKGVL